MSNLLTQPFIQFQYNGEALAGGLVFFYESGTTTKTAVYQDNIGTVAPNPVTLDSNGMLSNSGSVIPIYLPHDQAVKIVVAPAGSMDPPISTLWDVDPVIGELDVDYSNYFTTTGTDQINVPVGKTLNVAGSLVLTGSFVASGVTSFGFTDLYLQNIIDVNGKRVLNFTPTSSSVNYVSITNAAAGGTPTILAAGSDANIPLTLAGKGSSVLNLGKTGTTAVVLGGTTLKLNNNQPIVDSAGNSLLSFTAVASAVNNVNVTAAIAGANPILGTAGTDATIGLNITTKNSAPVVLTNNALQYAADITLSSAATTNIGGAASNNIVITGTTTITALGTAPAGSRRKVKFTGALTLTHNGTSLILPGNANFTTAANDTCEFESLGSGNWICTQYQKQSVVPGQSLTGGGLSAQTVYLASTTWTSPNRNIVALIRCWGGGGGSGFGTSTSFALYPGSGGGGGAYSEATVAISPNTLITITVGAGGGELVAGGTSSVSGAGFTTVTAGGGRPGLRDSGSGVLGGAGGTASGGNLNIPGGTAGQSLYGNTYYWLTTGSSGGDCPMGGAGGNYGTYYFDATAGTFPGGGGGSGVLAGKAGANGCVSITY
jgi:hypothetical protein